MVSSVVISVLTILWIHDTTHHKRAGAVDPTITPWLTPTIYGGVTSAATDVLSQTPDTPIKSTDGVPLAFSTIDPALMTITPPSLGFEITPTLTPTP